MDTEAAFIELSKVIYPDLFKAFQDPLALFNNAKVQLVELWPYLKNIPPEFIFARLCSVYPILQKNCPPFLLFEAKPTKKSKVNLFYLLIHEDSDLENPIDMICYNPETHEETKTQQEVAALIYSKENEYTLHCFNGTTTSIFMTENNPDFQALIQSFFSYKKTNAFIQFIKCLKLIKSELPLFPSLIDAIRAIFEQFNYENVRKMIQAPFDFTSKRQFATGLFNIFTDRFTVNYYINSLIALYFMQDLKPQEIMRTDSLLTNSLAVVRETIAPHFFENFFEYLIKSIKHAKTTDEVLTIFLEQTESLVVPDVLKWVCKLLFNEARRKFPDGDAPYYAISGYFFLRSIGPYFAQIDDKKKANSIFSLCNLCKKPETEAYIDKFKRILDKLIDCIDMKVMFSPPKPQDFENAMITFIQVIKNNSDNLIKHLSTITPSGEHPCLWFIRRICDICNEQFDKDLPKT